MSDCRLDPDGWLAHCISPGDGAARGTCLGMVSQENPATNGPAVRIRALQPRGIQAHADGVRFDWDQRKSTRNFRERGFDFEFATLIFGGPTLERDDTRRDYGKRRVPSAWLRASR